MANSYAAVHGKAPFVVSSPNHSLAVPREPMWKGCVYLPGDRKALAWYEETQLHVARIDRACDVTDIIDNVTGAVIGVALGLALLPLPRPWRPRQRG